MYYNFIYIHTLRVPLPCTNPAVQQVLAPARPLSAQIPRGAAVTAAASPPSLPRICSMAFRRRHKVRDTR